MSNYLFIFSISPVQYFISQARKTKDLYAGSILLSELCKKATEEFQKKKGEIILPSSINIKSLPNRFLGKIETKKGKLQKIGEEIEKEVRKDFQNTANNIKEQFINGDFSEFDKQINDFLEIYWVFYPIKEGNYKEAYLKIEKTIGAIKNLRQFKQLEESGKKCSLCGERNALFYNKNKKPKYISKNAINISNNSIADNEALCAICYLKRIQKQEFPSLAKITLLDWLEKVNYENLKKTEDFDEQWFFEYNERSKIKDFIQDKKNNLDIKKLKKYFALIRLDVDDMGQWLSGKKGNYQNLKVFQKKLSEKLNKFTKNAKEIVNKKGKTIYAGGDDFLGFVNLSHLFEVIKNFNQTFKFNNDFYELTYSVSIVIAHYKSPLHKVLDFSKELLENTKNFFDNKNGIGTIVMSNSAINLKCFSKYKDFLLLEELLKHKVANNLHFKLSQEFHFLKDVFSFDKYLINKEMLKVEIKRFLKREEKDFNKQLYTKLLDFLNTQTIEERANSYRINFDNFIGFLKTLEQLRKVI